MLFLPPDAWEGGAEGGAQTGWGGASLGSSLHRVSVPRGRGPLPTLGGDPRAPLGPTPPLHQFPSGRWGVGRGLSWLPPPSMKGPFSPQPKVLREPAVDASSCARASAPQACLYACLHVWAPGPGFLAAPFGVPQHGVAEGPDPPLLATGPVEAPRPVVPAWVGQKVSLWRPPGQSSRPGWAGAWSRCPSLLGPSAWLPGLRGLYAWHGGDWGREGRPPPWTSPSSCVF